MPDRERYFAGVDGGATKTVCVVSDARGSVLGEGAGGPSNCHNVGVKEALAELRGAVAGAVASAGLGASGGGGRRGAGGRRRNGGQLAVACFGLAGLDSPLDERNIKRGVSSMGFARSNHIVHDTVVALAGALAGDPGVIVIAGTGSVAGGMDAKGRTVRVGGWGYILGDEGSAYDIGRRGLASALLAYDGRGIRTELLPRLMRRVGAKTPEGIVEAVYLRGMSVSEMAALSPVVVECAEEGDEAAREVLSSSGRSLGGLAVGTASKLSMLGERFKVSTAGGVFGAGELVLGPFRERLLESAPLAEVVPPRFPPAVGALILALKRGGVRVDSGVTRRIEDGLKGGDALLARPSTR